MWKANKNPLISCLFFKGIFVISWCILIIYYLLYLCKYQSAS
jgi:hypothetical protein